MWKATLQSDDDSEDEQPTDEEGLDESDVSDVENNQMPQPMEEGELSDQQGI